MRFTTNAALPQNQQSAWQKAALGTNQADPFCCAPAWQLPFHEALLPERRLVFAEGSGSALILAETVQSPNEIYLTSPEVGWFFGCPLLGPHAVDLLVETLPLLVRAHAPAFPRFIISGIRPGGELGKRLWQNMGKSFTFYLHSGSVQCSASLENGVDGFMARRSANHRAKLRKDARRAAAAGVYFERVNPANAAEAEGCFKRMLAVEGQSWKGLGACGMTEAEPKAFYAAMLRRLADSKEGRVIFARHEGKDIGFIFGGLARNIYRGQQFSYIAEWKDFSIGNLLQLEKITWLCEEGVKRYDMGSITGPRMEYKSHWTEKRAPIESWLLIKNS